MFKEVVNIFVYPLKGIEWQGLVVLMLDRTKRTNRKTRRL